ncbi:MAG TPA: hypothetical protein VIM07_17785 [Chitinophagaceae bacterium]
MKKNFFTIVLSLIIVCFFSTNTFAQPAPGGSAGGGTGLPSDPGTTAGTPTLTFDFGSAGIVTMASTSPYYNIIISLLTRLHATIAPDGSVTFPTTTGYRTCLLPLYYTGCINYRTYQTCKYQAPPPCTYPTRTSCGH